MNTTMKQNISRRLVYSNKISFSDHLYYCMVWLDGHGFTPYRLLELVSGKDPDGLFSKYQILIIMDMEYNL